jgi:hypothetical protein
MRKTMNKPLFCVLIYALSTLPVIAGDNPNRAAGDPAIRHITTAVDHLSVLEYDEPVVMAAVGSPAFQIERQENKVFIKPSRAGVTTNLFVWTGSNQRFGYELVVGDVASMNASIHEAGPKPAPATTDSTAQSEVFADSLITRTILASRPIESVDVKPSQTNKLELKVKQVFSTANTIYIQYTLENLGLRSYRITAPRVVELVPQHPHMNPISVRGKQIDKKLVAQLGDAREIPRVIVHSDTASNDIDPRTIQQGVVAIQRTGQHQATTIFQLAFDTEVKAAFVF